MNFLDKTKNINFYKENPQILLQLIHCSHTSLPYEQVAEFIQQLRQKKGISPKALEFAILPLVVLVKTLEQLGKKSILNLKFGLFRKNG